MSSTEPAVNPNKALWEKGDFTRIAAAMRDSGASLVASLGVHEGMRVLDLGCGDGTTAVPAAHLRGNTVAVPGRVQAVLRPDDERLRRCGRRRAGGPAARGARGTGARPEHESQR